MKISHSRTRLTDITFGGSASLPNDSMMIIVAPKIPLNHRCSSSLTLRRSSKVELTKIFGLSADMFRQNEFSSSDRYISSGSVA